MVNIICTCIFQSDLQFRTKLVGFPQLNHEADALHQLRSGNYSFLHPLPAMGKRNVCHLPVDLANALV